MHSYIGYVTELSGSHYDCMFETYDDIQSWLYNQHEIEEERIPLDTLVQVDGEIVDGEIVVSDWRVYVASERVPDDEEPKHYHLAVFAVVRERDRNNLDRLIGAKLFADERAAKTQAFWKNIFKGDRIVDCRGFVLITDEHTQPPAFCRESVAEFKVTNQEYIDSGWEFNYYHLEGGFNPGFNGHGGGNKSVTYGGAPMRTTIHETGHTAPGSNVWLLPHNGKFLPNGRLSEYGGDSCMGRKYAILTARELHQLQFLEDTYIMRNPDQGEFFLASANLRHFSVCDREHQAIRFDVNNANNDSLIDFGNYWVSVQSHAGPYASTQDYQKVNIHVFGRLKSTNEMKYVMLAELAKGESYTINGNVIKVEDFSANGTARVSVNGTQSIAEFPDPFEQIKQGAPLSSELSGLWMNEEMDGQGFLLNIDGEQSFGGWYTFDDRGHQRWYVMETDEVGDDYIIFNVYWTEGGTVEAPNTATLNQQGRVLYTFPSDHTAQMIWDMDDLGRGEQDLIKFTPTTSGVESGWWYNPSRNKEGILTHVHEIMIENEIRNEIVGFFYTYGPELSRWDADTTQRWYMVQGLQNENGVFECDIYLANGTHWLSYQSANIDIVGRGTIQSIGNELMLDFDIEAIEYETYPRDSDINDPARTVSHRVSRLL